MASLLIQGCLAAYNKIPIGNLYYDIFDNGTASIIGFVNKELKDLTITGEISYKTKNYRVISIGNESFVSSSLSGKVTLPDQLEYIFPRAFHKTHINSVVFGSKLIEIGEQAFSYCFDLNCELILPESLKAIGDDCFFNSKITGTVNGVNLKSIGKSCFASTRIKHFVFPKDFTVIPPELFALSDLEGEVVLPESIVEIGDESFSATKITLIEFPTEKELVIGEGAFFDCKNLQTTIQYNTIFKKIGPSAFYNTQIKATLIISEEISIAAFQKCNSLTGTVIILSKKICDGAFLECSNIQYVSLKNVEIMEANVFALCSSLKGVDFVNCKIKKITDMAFSYCQKLQGIGMPETIEEIGVMAFYRCSSWYGTLDLRFYPNLKKIGKFAFVGCDGFFGELKLPQSLEIIDDYAFTNGLFSGSLVIPDNVTRIGKYAFYECTKLNGMLYIGKSITVIDDSAFALCSQISGNIIFGQKVTKICNSAFFKCISLKGNLILPESLEVIEESAFFGCSNLIGNLIFKHNIVKIGMAAFAECKGFTGTLLLPKNIREIGENAFYNCYGFKDVKFESDEIAIEPYAFSNLHIKCFYNAPNAIKDNNPTIYSSDNFKGVMLPSSFLNFNCQAFYTIDSLLIILTSSAVIAVLSTVGTYLYNLYKNRKTNISTFVMVFSDIFESSLNEEGKNEEEIANTIVNRINDRILVDLDENQFTLTRKQADIALQMTIEDKWPIATIKCKRFIMEKSFNDIVFKEKSFDFKNMCKCSKKGEEKSESVLLAQL